MRYLLTLVLISCHAFAAEEVYVGWISDSQCALARASSGKYTATNPDCARKCIKDGKGIVLISPDAKTVFTIENPESVRSQIGNKVRIYAESTGTHVLHVEKVLFLEAANPECERPPLKN